MTQLCSIAGTIHDRRGDPVANTQVLVESRQRVVSGGNLLFPSVETFMTNSAGFITMTLYSGTYLVTITYEGQTEKFSIQVPDSPEASFDTVVQNNAFVTGVAQGPPGPRGGEFSIEASTDESIMRYNADLEELEDSSATIDDDGNLVIAGSLIVNEVFRTIVTSDPPALELDDPAANGVIRFRQDDASAIIDVDPGGVDANSNLRLLIDGSQVATINRFGHLRLGGAEAPTVTAEFGGNDAILIPAGTTGERPTGTAGYLRYNSTLNRLEVYDGENWQQPLTEITGLGTTFLSRAVASNDATIEFTDFDGATYDAYTFVLSNVIPQTDGVSLLMQLSNDGGQTWITAADYEWRGTVNSSTSSQGTATATGFQVNNSILIGNDAGKGLSGDLKLFAPHTVSHTVAKWDMAVTNTSGALINSTTSGMYLGAAEAHDAVRFIMSSGNIASGIISMFGMRNS